MPNRAPPVDFAPRRLWLLVEDDALAELLAELLAEAGQPSERLHDAAELSSSPSSPSSLPSLPSGSVILVDLDRDARDGATLVAALRQRSPASAIVALLPCGGLPPGAGPVDYDLAVEKPARLSAVLQAIRKLQ